MLKGDVSFVKSTFGLHRDSVWMQRKRHARDLASAAVYRDGARAKCVHRMHPASEETRACRTVKRVKSELYFESDMVANLIGSATVATAVCYLHSGRQIPAHTENFSVTYMESKIGRPYSVLLWRYRSHAKLLAIERLSGCRMEPTSIRCIADHQGLVTTTTYLMSKKNWRGVQNQQHRHG